MPPPPAVALVQGARREGLGCERRVVSPQLPPLELHRVAKGAGRGQQPHQRRRPRLLQPDHDHDRRLAHDALLVAQLRQELARLRLDRAQVLRGELGPPAADLGLQRRRGVELVERAAQLRGRLAAADLSAGQITELAQALLGPLVGAEHRRIPVQLDQLADPPQRRLGVAHQVLVSHLDAALEPGRLVAGLEHRVPPDAGAPSRPPAVADAGGERDVAAVADHVDEAGLGQQRADQPQRVHVPRGLVAPAGLALSLGVEPVEGAQGVRERHGGLPDPVGDRRLLQPEVAEPPLAGQRRGEARAVDGAIAEGLRQAGDEMRLRRDRQLRMGVEHQPQQGRAGSACPDHERRRRGLGAHRPSS